MNAQHAINRIENRLRRIDAKIQWIQNSTDEKQQAELQRLRKLFNYTFKRKQALLGEERYDLDDLGVAIER